MQDLKFNCIAIFIGFGGRGNRGGGRHNDRASRGVGFGNRGRRDEQSKDRPVDQGIDTTNPTIAPFVDFARYNSLGQYIGIATFSKEFLFLKVFSSIFIH